MTHAEAVFGLTLVDSGSWPLEVDFDSRLVRLGPNDYAVDVKWQAPGEAANVYRLFATPTPEAVNGMILTAEAQLVAAMERAWLGSGGPPGGSVATAEGDDGRDWERATLARVAGLRGVRRGPKRLAALIVRSLEFLNIPFPAVRAFRGSVVLTWASETRVVELTVPDGQTWRAFPMAVDRRYYGGFTYHVGPGGEHTKLGVSPARSFVAWGLGRLA